MTKKQLKPRVNSDRRHADYGPPGVWKERRRTAERRLPEIQESEISEAEWLLHFGAIESAENNKPSDSAAPPIAENVAEVFGRVRD